MKRALAVVLFFGLAGFSAFADNLDFAFTTPEQKQRFIELTRELRCLVCQNQSLGDSKAGLADDLRREVYNMMRKGMSDKEIVDFLVARYGEFVLYRPKLKPTTYLLWYGPALLLLIGLSSLAYLIRRRSRLSPPTPTPEELERVRRLLDQDR